MIISAILGVIYSVYIVSYFSGLIWEANSGAEVLGGMFASALVTPHMACVVVAAILNVIAALTNKRGFALAGAILYTIAAALFVMYAMFVLPSIILSFVGCAKLGKNAQTETGQVTEADFALMRRIQHGDREAFAAFYASYNVPVFKIAMDKTGNNQQQSILIVKDVFRETHRAIRAYGPYRGNLHEWLYNLTIKYAAQQWPQYAEPQYTQAQPQHTVPHQSVGTAPPQAYQKPRKVWYKRAWVWALIAVAGVLIFADQKPDSAAPPANTPAVSSSQGSANVQNPSTNSMGSPSPSRIEIPSDGIVVFDNDGIVITAQSVKREKSGHITGLDLLIENNSGVEKNVCVWPDAAFGGPISVNGYSMKSTFNETVADGKMAKATLKFDSDTVGLLGFDNLYELIAPFGTYESRDDYMKHEIKPYAPSVLTLGDFSATHAGELVYNENSVEVYKCGFKKSTFFYDYAIFVVKNGLGSDRRLTFDSVSINKLMDNSNLAESTDMYKDTYSVVLLPLRYDDGDKYTEENVTEIEFTLKSEGINEIISMDTETVGVITILY